MFGEIFSVLVVVVLFAALTVLTTHPVRRTVKTRILAADARRAAAMKVGKPVIERPRPRHHHTDPAQMTPDEIGYAVSELFRP